MVAFASSKKKLSQTFFSEKLFPSIAGDFKNFSIILRQMSFKCRNLIDT